MGHLRATNHAGADKPACDLKSTYQQYPQDAPLPCAERTALTDVNAHLPNLSQRQPQPRGEYSVLPHRTLTE